MRMNIYVHDKGILLTGKTWEVRQKLKEYGKCYTFVSDWIKHESNHISPSKLSYHKPSLIMNQNKKES